MKEARNERNPVRAVLDEYAPTYWGWFDRWRALRNQLKEGTSVHLQGPVTDLAIGFSINDGDAHVGHHVVRLDDATEALRESAAVIGVTLHCFTERFG
jgi:hypothetical protein